MNFEQEERYARHISLKEIGKVGQEKLLASSVLIIGAGGLGSPAAMYLAASGVGTVGIADFDCVDISNLQRQIIHRTSDIGVPKAVSARQKMQDINPDAVINVITEKINEENARKIIRSYDFILDCTDNFDSKFLINDACVAEQKPFCHGGMLRFQGQIMTYVPNFGPCYRCLFKNPPPKEAVVKGNQAGIVGAMCGVIGSLMALEAVKYITGAGQLLTGSLLTFDALKMNFRKITVPKDENCPVCSDR